MVHRFLTAKTLKSYSYCLMVTGEKASVVDQNGVRGREIIGPEGVTHVADV
jgi:hypothetical protein